MVLTVSYRTAWVRVRTTRLILSARGFFPIWDTMSWNWLSTAKKRSTLSAPSPRTMPRIWSRSCSSTRPSSLYLALARRMMPASTISRSSIRLSKESWFRIMP